MSEPSPRYFAALQATRNFHATQKTFNGRFFLHYLDDIKAVIDELGCKTMLDYGCGKGRQWKEPIDDAGTMLKDYLGIRPPTLFDPGWSEYDQDPKGKFDIVVCTQALGSIPISDLPWVVDRLHSFATKAIFVGERLGPVKKQLHAHMRDEMPHEWTHEQWAEILKRPDGKRVVLKTRHNSIEQSKRLEIVQ